MNPRAAPNCSQRFKSCFDTMCFTVPAVTENPNPLYESIVGQKLYVVDWLEIFEIPGGIPCPLCSCALVERSRTNYSKHKDLFPIFGVDGPPAWVITKSYECPECPGPTKRIYKGTDGDLLVMLPEWVASHYPVDPQYAIPGAMQHLAKMATTIFEDLMLTYGNGDLCSTLMFSSINSCYRKQAMSYYSKCKRKKFEKPAPFPERDGIYITKYPPTGNTVRNIYDQASASTCNFWAVSEKERHIREIQMVKCSKKFAQDHTFEVVKNYIKPTGAKALWDASTETGEVASAVLVKDTSTAEFAHAAEQLTRRPHFNPTVMYSDTWPDKDSFWELLFGPSLLGRLGMFHWIQRVTKYMRDNHVDFETALAELLNCIYDFNDNDLKLVVNALRTGIFTGFEMTDNELAAYQKTRQFRRRFMKYLRKRIRAHHVIKLMLSDWHTTYKVNESPDARPAQGRLDPKTKDTLFTKEMKDKLELAKESARYIQDPENTTMYIEVPPKQNSRHGLSEWISLRGESKLESFHDILAHFANCGMRESVADALNLCGTARWNRKIRYKLWLVGRNQDQRNGALPAYFEEMVSHWNHSELHYINQLAESLGLQKLFTYVELLNKDNGERFFSEYYYEREEVRLQNPFHEADRCPCAKCTGNATALPYQDELEQARAARQRQENAEEEQRRNELVERSRQQREAEQDERQCRRKEKENTRAQIQQPPSQESILPVPQQPMPTYQNMAFQQPMFMMTPSQFNWAMQPQQPLFCCIPFQQWYCLNPMTRARKPSHDRNNCNRCAGYTGTF